MTTIHGWTLQQFAAARTRHAWYGNPAPSQDLAGLLALQEWWYERGAPEPLSVVLEGVPVEKDMAWAAPAFFEAARQC